MGVHTNSLHSKSVAVLCLLLGAGSIGCSPDLPAPQLLSVSPDEWYHGLDVEVTISGVNLYPQVRVIGGELEVDREFRAWLESETDSIELEGLSLQSYTELTGFLRAGLSPGVYDLRLLTPAGESATLEDAFTAADSSIKSVNIDYYGGYSPQVDESVEFIVSLEGWGDERIQDPLEVEIIVERDDGAVPDIEFNPTSLDDQRTLELEGAAGIRGTLNESGETLILFTSFTPGAVDLEVRPVEDSSIQHDSLDLYFEPGSVDDLSLSLADQAEWPAALTAGDSLDLSISLIDHLGNPTETTDGLILLVSEACADGNQAIVPILDTYSLSFTVQGACEENQLTVAVAASSGEDMQVASPLFSVVPGAPDHFSISTSRDAITAGEEVLLLISVEDAFDNRIEYSDELLFAEAGGDAVEATCQVVEDGQSICRIQLVEAGEEVVIEVTGAGESLVGESAAITVLASDPVQVSLETSAQATTADETREVSLSVFDVYNNPVTIPQSGGEAPVFSLGGDAVDCDLAAAEGEDSALVYDCTITTAATDHVLSVDVLALQGSSEPFVVVNGVLTTVSLTGPGDVTAGEPVSLTLIGTDAYSNPYIEAGSSGFEIELIDESGDVSEMVSLGADGSASLSALLFTTAWHDNRLHAYQGGVWLGESSTFDVSAALMEGFEVEAEQAWTWLDTPLSVTLRAVDDYGNLVEDYSGSAVLSSALGLGDDVVVADFSGGEADAEFTFSAAALSDELVISDGDYAGTSALIDALSADCAAPPEVVLEVDGATYGLACRVNGITDPLQLSAASSVAGGAALSAWHFYSSGWERSTTADMEETWTAEGAWPVEVVVADADACGASASTVVYVADDDGQPAGPVEISSSSSSLAAGTTSSSGQATISMHAATCSGADAAGGSLLVRADIGELTGSSLAASGTGLRATLDNSGDAELEWDVGSQDFAGDGSLYAGRSDGAAMGAVAVEITDDSHSPVVHSFSAAGSSTELYRTFEVQFSEDIDEDTINNSSVRMLDPDGLAVDILDHTLTGSLLELTLEENIDTLDGMWTLWLGSGITDLAGNGLAGTYTGSAAAFSLSFGLVSDGAPALEDCSGDVSLFRPDGDSASGEEADAISLTATADGVAEWWLLKVRDADSDVVLTRYISGGTPTAIIEWDGRGEDGRVLGNSDYTLQVQALDAYWNTSGTCEIAVSIDNRIP